MNVCNCLKEYVVCDDRATFSCESPQITLKRTQKSVFSKNSRRHTHATILKLPLSRVTGTTAGLNGDEPERASTFLETPQTP